jgi:hypothetical protein
MNNAMDVFGAVNSIAFIEPIFRILAYMAFISLCYRAIQALNIYINKNSR